MSETIFFRLLYTPVDEKGAVLAAQIRGLQNTVVSTETFKVSADLLSGIPGSPIAYWATPQIVDVFRNMPALKQEYRHAQSGGSTKQDFRFLRLWWECPLDAAARSLQATFDAGRWVPFEKGGSQSTYFRDWELVIDWLKHGKAVKSAVADYRGSRGWGYDWSGDIKGHSFYFRPGLTWPRRSDGLSFRILQPGCIFSDKGPAIFVDGDDPVVLLALCAILNTKSFGALVATQLGRVWLAQSYEVGLIQQTPVPDVDQATQTQLADLAKQIIDGKRVLDSVNETSHFFCGPAILTKHLQRFSPDSLDIGTNNALLQASKGRWQRFRIDTEQRLSQLQSQVERIVAGLYGLEDSQFNSDSEDQDPTGLYLESGEALVEESFTDEPESNSTTEITDLIPEFFSFLVGCIYGRWDIDNALGYGATALPTDHFVPLPILPPGMMVERQLGADLQTAYPPIPALVDDPGHPDDLVTRIRDVLALIYADRADVIYQELVDLLVGSGHDLRPYLRSQFFDFHIKRYSKSRRKAPIYWRLATPSGAYAVWLYYHRVDQDTLYKVLNDYVLPKLQHEERQLAAQQQAAGPTPTAAQRKAMEAQTRFVEELQTFRAELARVAPLWDPDRNDGVILNFAPLWRLAPSPKSWQEECRRTWDALRRGDYDWAHLSLRLWPGRVVANCRTDRSLAIAHGLDEVFWQEEAHGKATPRPVDEATVQALIAARRSVAIERALADLQEAPIAQPKVKAPASKATAAPAKKARPKATDFQIGLALDAE